MLLKKYTSLFPDVSPVTISGIIARERANKSQDFKVMDERIMKKVLWYRDLPVEENKVAGEVSYDQASYKYQKPRNASSPSPFPAPAPSQRTAASPSPTPLSQPESGLRGTIDLSKTNRAVDSPFNSFAHSSSPASSATSSPAPSLSKSSGSSTGALPPMPSPKRAPVPSGTFKAPPPPPSIASTPTTYTDSGYLFESELRTFVVSACQDYLRSNAKYAIFLSQTYHPFASHHTSLSSSICQEVAAIIPRQITEVDKSRSKISYPTQGHAGFHQQCVVVVDESRYDQKAVVQKIVVAADNVMKTIMGLGSQR